MSRRFARNGWPRASEIIAALTITASATPHDEGAYVEIDASAAQNVCGIYIRNTATIAQSTVDTSMLFTLAFGAAGSEVDVIPSYALGGHMSNTRFTLPIHIPAGSRIAGKLRAEVVSDTFVPAFTLFFGGQMPGWGGYTSADAIGADTANSRGTPISNTAGTYTELSASITNALRGISASFGLVDATSSAGTQTVDVAVGAAGSEVIIGSWTVNTTATEELIVLDGPSWLEVPIAAGSRIAVKKDNTMDLSCVVHGWR